MRKLIGLLTVVLFFFLVVGYFRGWLTFSHDGAGTESGKVTVTLDGDKVKEDAKKAKDKTKELSHEAKDEAKDLANQGRDSVRSSGE